MENKKQRSNEKRIICQFCGGKYINQKAKMEKHFSSIKHQLSIENCRNNIRIEDIFNKEYIKKYYIIDKLKKSIKDKTIKFTDKEIIKLFMISEDNDYNFTDEENNKIEELEDICRNRRSSGSLLF